MPLKRPFGVTMLLWLVLIVIVWGVVRCFAALQNRDMLIEFGSGLSPLYLSVSGASWGVAGGVLLWSLLTVQAWSRRVVVAAASVWLLEYWVERGVFYQSSNPNLVFALAFSGLLLGLVLAITAHKRTKNFFTRSEEYEQHNENPNLE
jgi:hypothetical protein